MAMTRGTFGLGFWLAAGLSVGACPPAPAQTAEILVPAYQYPTLGTMWGTLPGSASRVRLSVIVNPASGPGTSVDPTYTAVVNAVRAAGGRVLGYVDTAYAARPINAVLADVSTFISFYALDGIFFDQMDNAPGSLAYYQSLTSAVHGVIPGGAVVANPGTSVPESFIADGAADVIVTYENNAFSSTEPYTDNSPPAWVFNYPASRFCHIVYNVPDAATMRAYTALAESRHVGVVYFTDRLLPNPYDQLPPYWNEEVCEVRSRSTGCRADFDANGFVSGDDFDAYVAAFEIGDPGSDFNCDGFVSGDDFDAFVSAFEAGC